MSTTTYCTAADVAFVLSSAGVAAHIDDNGTGGNSVAELQYVVDAIEMAAGEITAEIRRQYVVAETTGNTWLKWANAWLAAEAIASRRLQAPTQSLMDRCKYYRDWLQKIGYGKRNLPDQDASFDHLPTVSNFLPSLGRVHPVRVSLGESTGPAPVNGIGPRNSGF